MSLFRFPDHQHQIEEWWSVTHPKKEQVDMVIWLLICIWEMSGLILF
jgi:hypothetical protein